MQVHTAAAGHWGVCRAASSFVQSELLVWLPWQICKLRYDVLAAPVRITASALPSLELCRKSAEQRAHDSTQAAAGLPCSSLRYAAAVWSRQRWWTASALTRQRRQTAWRGRTSAPPGVRSRPAACLLSAQGASRLTRVCSCLSEGQPQPLAALLTAPWYSSTSWAALLVAPLGSAAWTAAPSCSCSWVLQRSTGQQRTLYRPVGPSHWMVLRTQSIMPAAGHACQPRTALRQRTASSQGSARTVDGLPRRLRLQPDFERVKGVTDERDHDATCMHELPEHRQSDVRPASATLRTAGSSEHIAGHLGRALQLRLGIWLGHAAPCLAHCAARHLHARRLSLSAWLDVQDGPFTSATPVQSAKHTD